MASLTMTVPELSTHLAHLGLESQMPEIPAADVLVKPLDIFRSHLANLVASALGCDVSLAYDSIRLSNDLSQGDLEVVLPKLKLENVEPGAVVQKLQTSPLFEAPYHDGPVIRFLFSASSLPRLLFPYIEDRKSSYGKYESQGLVDSVDPSNLEVSSRKKVVVEFSSPNVGKEFNGHHLRSTIIGAFVSNIYACMGWDVVRLNYLGDWGKELALLAIGFQRFGSEEALESNALGHMLGVFTKIRELIQPELDEYKRAKDEGHSTVDLEGTGLFAERDTFFKNLETGDEGATNLWKKFRDISIEHLETSYNRLGIKFDEYSGESQVDPNTMAEVEATLKAEGVLEENDGSWVINFEKHVGKAGKGLGTQTIRGRNGSTTYLLRDIAAVFDRERQHSFDKMIYVVSFRQDMHFQQLFLALKLMKRDDLERKLQHVSFGDVQGMTGYFEKPLLLQSIVDEYGTLMRDATIASAANGKPVAEIRDVIELSGFLLQDISGKKRAHAYTFHPERKATVEGDPSVRLQSLYANLESAIAGLHTKEVEAAPLDCSALEDESTLELLGILARYPETTAAAFKSLEPHAVFTYLSTLATAVAKHLADPQEEAGEGAAQDDMAVRGLTEDGNCWGCKEDLGACRARLELYQCARQVLENGMMVLGFQKSPK